MIVMRFVVYRLSDVLAVGCMLYVILLVRCCFSVYSRSLTLVMVRTGRTGVNYRIVLAVFSVTRMIPP